VYAKAVVVEAQTLEIAITEVITTPNPMNGSRKAIAFAVMEVDGGDGGDASADVTIMVRL